MNTELIKKFHNKYIKEDDCWLWTGQLHTYHETPLLRFEGKMYNARRISYILKFGETKLRVFGCPLNRICVNPNHLTEKK